MCGNGCWGEMGKPPNLSCRHPSHFSFMVSFFLSVDVFFVCYFLSSFSSSITYTHAHNGLHTIRIPLVQLSIGIHHFERVMQSGEEKKGEKPCMLRPASDGAVGDSRHPTFVDVTVSEKNNNNSYSAVPFTPMAATSGTFRWAGISQHEFNQKWRTIRDRIEKFLIKLKRGKYVPNETASLSVQAACEATEILQQIVTLYEPNDVARHNFQASAVINHVKYAGRLMQRTTAFKLLLANVTRRVLWTLRDAAQSSTATMEDIIELESESVGSEPRSRGSSEGPHDKDEVLVMHPTSTSTTNDTQEPSPQYRLRVWHRHRARSHKRERDAAHRRSFSHSRALVAV